VYRAIDYYGNNTDGFQQVAGPGGWNDPDQVWPLPLNNAFSCFFQLAVLYSLNPNKVYLHIAGLRITVM